MGFACVSGGSECNGCMACQKSPHYYCPVCGEEVYEAVYVDNDGEVIGCEECVHIKDVYEVLEDEAY